jgi:hypothetical protein
METLKTYNAKELLLTFSQSDRVKSDLEFALNKPERWDQAFVVRKWYEISPSMEFRGYVCKGKLNALSQYNYVCCYPLVVKHAEAIKMAILNFFNETIHRLLSSKFTDYIIDFVMVGEKETEGGKGFSFSRILVIELNPFLSSTDALLFSWKDDLERFQNGPFEFRVQPTPIPGITSKVSSEWRQLLQEEGLLLLK